MIIEYDRVFICKFDVDDKLFLLKFSAVIHVFSLLFDDKFS